MQEVQISELGSMTENEEGLTEGEESSVQLMNFYLEF